MGFDPERGLLDPGETRDRQVWSGNVAERMWDWLTRDQDGF